MRKFTIAGLGCLGIYLAYSFALEDNWVMTGLMCLAVYVCGDMLIGETE